MKESSKKKAAPTKESAAPKIKVLKPIGEVTHFYGGIGVAIAKFKRPVKLGENLRYKGATTDFEEPVESMQYDHKPIAEAKKGQEVGIKVKGKVREGDEIFAG